MTQQSRWLRPQDATDDEARVKYLLQDQHDGGKISERMKTELTNRKRSPKESKLLPGQIGLDAAPDLVQVPIHVFGQAWGWRTQVRRVSREEPREAVTLPGRSPRSRCVTPALALHAPGRISLPGTRSRGQTGPLDGAELARSGRDAWRRRSVSPLHRPSI